MIIAKPDRLSEMMARSGFTGVGLAKATKLSQGYICQIMSGKRAPLPPTAKKICDALGCGFDEVFEVKEKKIWQR